MAVGEGELLLAPPVELLVPAEESPDGAEVALDESEVDEAIKSAEEDPDEGTVGAVQETTARSEMARIGSVLTIFIGGLLVLN
jgi:hypothetical protein